MWMDLRTRLRLPVKVVTDKERKLRNTERRYPSLKSEANANSLLRYLVRFKKKKNEEKNLWKRTTR